MSARQKMKNLRPLWLGIVISASLLLIMLLIEIALGRVSKLLIAGEFDPLASVSSGVLRDARIAFIHCLVIGYLPAAFLHVLSNGRRTVLALQGTLDCTPEECENLSASVRLNTGKLIIIGIMAFLLSLAMPYLVPPVPLTPWDPRTWSPEVAWHRILGPAAMIWGWWLAYAIISVSLRMSRIAKTLCKVDLLDLSPLAPFTQLGLTNALLLIGSLSIWSLMMIETGFGQVMLVIGGATLLGTAIALIAPVYGVRKRIRQSKEEKLNWVNNELSKQLKPFQCAQDEHSSGRMADLVAYRGLIESVSEWPFTSSTYTRIALYVLLPVATWGIGLFAEEIFGRIFLG